MSNSDDIRKPYAITLAALIKPKASKLQVSYNLKGSFLGLPEEPGVPQYLNVFGFFTTEFGQPKLAQTQFVRQSGFNALASGQTKIENKNRYVKPDAFIGTSFGTAFTKNLTDQIFPTSIYQDSYGRPTIYNLRQYVRHGGFHTAVFGAPYLIGGVKYVEPYGLYSLTFGTPKVINTTANQFVYPTGINAHSINGPLVSPRFLRASGFVSDNFGQVQVYLKTQFVLAKGQDQSKYGTPWVSHNPRHLNVQSFESFNPGYPRIFDKAQKILLANSPKIVGGVFGDIAVKNTRRYINVKGESHTSFSDWATVYSNRSFITPPGFNAALFGNTHIWNKTPSVFPGSFNASAFGSAMVADRIRKIQARGFSLLEVNRFGQAVFTKSPELNPYPFNSMAFGQPWISNFKQYIASVGALSSLRMGDDITVWFRYRNVSAQGFSSQAFNSPRIEHGSREILVSGFNASLFGQPITWYRVRTIAPSSIYRDFETNHMVGGTQHIKPQGFVASLFGSRIIPEIQNAYGQGFNASIISETHKIELYKRWVQLKGFSAAGTADSLRYGTAQVWNRTQIVQQNYDPNDGLNPGTFGQWSTIENRNKKIGAIGFNAARFGFTSIVNKARQIKLQSNVYTAFGVLMIADRIRYLRLEGIENPPISRWFIAYNAAAVISVKGQPHTLWGNPSVINTRRQYRWVGAFESMQFGQPMIAFRIRNIHIESRYSIAPIYLPIPKFDLHTRYIEPQGPETQAFGGPSLHIKWNIVTTRWAHRDMFGDPFVKNLTPEVKQRGANSEEFGKPSARLQWDKFPIEGFGNEIFGRSLIAFRDRSMSVSGFNSFGIGRATVTKTGAPPYSLQTITLDWDGEGERPDDYSGKGIEPPRGQVSVPSLKTNVIFASGFVATQIGGHHTQSNGILVQPGIQEFIIGEHTVGLKNRVIGVVGISNPIVVGRPRLTPHTIYAVTEAPSQAINNHAPGALRYVNSLSVFGRPNVTHYHRGIYAGAGNQGGVALPTLQLKKHFIRPNGIQSFRMGWHFLPDGSPRKLQQFDSSNNALYGRPTVTSPYFGPLYIRTGGFNAVAFGNNWIEHFHRTVKANGFNTLAMGAGRSGDTPYKPQGLWIGPQIPTIPKGFASELFGTTWISNKVRDISADGFDSLSNDWDISNFGQRLRVTKVKRPVIIEQKEVTPLPFSHTAYGVPNIRLKVHYIRPDGNSDQYRKGGPT